MKLIAVFLLLNVLLIQPALAQEAPQSQPEQKECSLCTQIAPALEAVMAQGKCLRDTQECALVSTMIIPHIYETAQLLAREDSVGQRARALVLKNGAADDKTLQNFMEKAAQGYEPIMKSLRAYAMEIPVEEKDFPAMFDILEAQSCQGKDKEECEKAKTFLFKLQGTLWFTLTGKAGIATRSPMTQSPDEDAKVYELMNAAHENTNQIGEKLEEILKNYK